MGYSGPKGMATRPKSSYLMISARLIFNLLVAMPFSLHGATDIRQVSILSRRLGRCVHQQSTYNWLRAKERAINALLRTTTMNTTIFQPAKHEISVQELKQKLDQNDTILLLDVREPHEYEFVHLQAAQLIPLNQLPQYGDELDKDAEIVIYCHHGQRSMYAAAYLERNGFQNVKSLTGGIDQWAIEIDSTLNRY